MKHDVAISVKNLVKEFSIAQESRPNSLKQMLSTGSFLSFLKSNSKNKTVRILDGISFEIKKGEFVGIMGRNGVGKSTLLRLIAGIYSPTSGTVDVSGTVAPMIELGAGFNGDLSAIENIYLNAAILGFGKKDTDKSVEDIIAFAELGEHIYRPVRNFSSGMLVRLGFSIACHLTAPILLLDEILAVGDAGFQEKCLERIHRLHKEGRTIILITHSSEAVKRHCQRCIVLDKKTKLFDGDPGRGADSYFEAVTRKGSNQI